MLVAVVSPGLVATLMLVALEGTPSTRWCRYHQVRCSQCESARAERRATASANAVLLVEAAAFVVLMAPSSSWLVVAAAGATRERAAMAAAPAVRKVPHRQVRLLKRGGQCHIARLTWVPCRTRLICG